MNKLYIRLCIIVVLCIMSISVVNATWCDTDYAKRINVSVNNTGGGALTDYQVHVNLSSDPINETSMRVYNSSDCSLRSHWSENVTGGNSYGVWINYSAVAASSWTNNTAIYYDNAAASTASNGTNTFKFFDDFENISLDTTFSFTQVYITPSLVHAHQSVAHDGTYYYTTKGTLTDSWIYKWNSAWSLVDSRNCTDDAPATKSQLNGIYCKDGKLYIGAGEHTVANGGTGLNSWCVEYNATDLSYITNHNINQTLDEDYYFTEGCSWHDSKWWCIYGGGAAAQGLLRTFNSTWVHQNDYFLDYNPGSAYQSILWHNDYIFVNQHGGYPPTQCDCYYWNGSGFEQHQRIDEPSGCNQDIQWDTDGVHTWWARRSGTTDGYAVKATFDESTSCITSSKWTIDMGTPNFCSDEQSHSQTHSMKLPDTEVYVSTAITASDNISIDMYVYPDADSDLRWLHGDGSWWLFIKINNGGSVYYSDGSNWIDTGIDATLDTWQEFRLYDFDWTAHTFKVYVNGNSASCDMRSGTQNTNSIRLDATSTSQMYVDDFRTRKYVSVSPTTILSAEEQQPWSCPTNCTCFAVGADSRTSYTQFNSTLQFLKEYKDELNFVIYAGDMDSVQTNKETYHDVEMSNLESYWCMGNHEIDGGAGCVAYIKNMYPSLNNTTNLFTDTRNSTYSIEYNNTHIVILDVYSEQANGNVPYGGSQYNWLKADLEATDRSRQIFVVGHEPAYPENRHIGDSLDQYPSDRNALWAMFDNKSVEGYFCGHTHFYSKNTSMLNVTQVDGGNMRWIGGADGDGNSTVFFVVVEETGKNSTISVYSSDTEGNNFNLTDEFILNNSYYKGEGTTPTLHIDNAINIKEDWGRDFNSNLSANVTTANASGVWMNFSSVEFTNTSLGWLNLTLDEWVNESHNVNSPVTNVSVDVYLNSTTSGATNDTDSFYYEITNRTNTATMDSVATQNVDTSETFYVNATCNEEYGDTFLGGANLLEDGTIVATNSSVTNYVNFSHSESSAGQYNYTVRFYNLTHYDNATTPTYSNVTVSDVEYKPPDATTLANSTGNFWINHTWSNGTGNVTNSYNVSVNLTWYNSTTNKYYNNTPLSAHKWSNVTVWAYNASGSGTLSAGSISQNTQIPNNVPSLSGLPDNTTTEDVNQTDIFDLDSYFTDADSDTPTYLVESNNQSGNVTVTINASNNVSYTLASEWNGTASVVINATDGYGGEDNDTFLIVVNAAAGPGDYTPGDPTTLQNTTGNYWVNYTWNVGGGNATDSYNVSWNATWYNTTLTAYMQKEVGASNWGNISVYAYNSSGNGSLSANNITDNVQAPAYVPSDYPPDTPTTLANTTGNGWVNYTWVSGGGANVTDSYNVSWNSTWYNNTLVAYMNDTVGEFGWANISVWAYNSSGNGSLSMGSISSDTQAGGGTYTTSMTTAVYNLVSYYGSVNSSAEQFGDDITNVDYVARYNNVNNTFTTHIMGTGGNNFTTVHGCGYFVYVNVSGSSTYNRNNISDSAYYTNLSTGWDTIGWTNATDTNAEGLINSLGSACKYTSMLNVNGWSYTTHTSGFSINNHVVAKGKGYWVWVNTNTNWNRNS